MQRLIATIAAAFVLGATLPASAASVDGVNIHWSSQGNGPQTVILEHGWTCDESSWSGQVPVLAQEYRVITLDLPGHGRSGMPATFSMELFARAVEAVRDEAKADRIVLAGHSMGTPVIRKYALMYPQRVAGLVLVDGLVQVPGGGGFPMPTMTGPEGLKARENMIRGMFSGATTPALQQQILTMMMRAPEATAAGAMTATMDSSQWSNEPVKVPVLAVYAEKSGLANHDAMKRIFPTAEYHEIPGSGHFLMMEKPAEFNRLLTTFLATVRY